MTTQKTERELFREMFPQCEDSDGHMKSAYLPAFNTFKKARAPLLSTIAQQGEAYLSEDDRCALISFSEQCNDSDADGFSIPKESLVRLVEIGCIRHCGFGKYETTRFGDYIVQKIFLQNPQLPLKTISEWNAEHALNHERTLAALISQKVEG